MAKSTKIYRHPENAMPPHMKPEAVADLWTASVDFDELDDYVARLCARIRQNVVSLKGHGCFKEVFIAETQRHLVALQKKDRHVLIFNHSEMEA